jgi:hypothetical protein
MEGTEHENKWHDISGKLWNVKNNLDKKLDLLIDMIEKFEDIQMMDEEQDIRGKFQDIKSKEI